MAARVNSTARRCVPSAPQRATIVVPTFLPDVLTFLLVVLATLSIAPVFLPALAAAASRRVEQREPRQGG